MFSCCCCCSVSKESFTLAVLLLLLLFTRRDWGSLRCAFYIPTSPIHTHIHSICAGGYRSNLAPPESQLFHPTRLPPLARPSISLWCILRFMFSYLCALFALHYQRPLWLSAPASEFYLLPAAREQQRSGRLQEVIVGETPKGEWRLLIANNFKFHGQLG